LHQLHSYVHPGLCQLQQEGTAAPSLAREHLQEMENLNGSEHQTREGIIKETLGSMFQGEWLFFAMKVRETYFNVTTSRF
jgi:hypothetical protein